MNEAIPMSSIHVHWVVTEAVYMAVSGDYPELCATDPCSSLRAVEELLAAIDRKPL
ncbi:hypothetical protein [Nocardia sp. NPDC057440]|uniref:hypothetical protein n=1 Tax=Nocardia sp. NPDC057440 TaxID=3346134 RepID=UPI0036720F68